MCYTLKKTFIYYLKATQIANSVPEQSQTQLSEQTVLGHLQIHDKRYGIAMVLVWPLLDRFSIITLFRQAERYENK